MSMQREIEALKEEIEQWKRGSAMSFHEAQGLRSEIERLKAELARLTPSGQVAEDRNIVAMELGSHPSQAKAQAAAARLAAQAQGYEVMKAERDALDAQLSQALTEKTDIAERCFKAERERDAAVADNAALLIHFRALLKVLWGADFERRSTEIACQAVLAQPHPGAAVLKERQEREETIKALCDALFLIKKNRAQLLHDETAAMDSALLLAGAIP